MITLVTTKMCIIHKGFRGFRVFSPASVLVILQLAISSNKHQRILDVIPSEIRSIDCIDFAILSFVFFVFIDSRVAFTHFPKPNLLNAFLFKYFFERVHSY